MKKLDHEEEAIILTEEITGLDAIKDEGEPFMTAEFFEENYGVPKY